MRKNKIAAIVVTYNRKELLRENLLALLSQDEKRFDILIINNHSTDGTEESISDLLLSNDRIFYEDTGRNLGGAGGFSYGIKAAVERGYSWVWLMDDDCIPKRNALSELLGFAGRQNGKFGFLSSVALWKDGTFCRMNVQRKSLFCNLKEPTKEERIVIASFVSMLIPTKVIKKVGLPIAEFFIWTDDWEYSRRISRHYPCYVVPKSRVLHKTEQNVGTSVATDDEQRLWRYRFAYRNEVYLYRREGIRGMLHIFIRSWIHIAKVLIQAKDHKGKRIWMIVGGTIEGFLFKPDIEEL